MFTKVYGLSPCQYLTRRKWSKAKELLAGSNLTVYAIAEQLGFRSVNHFSRQFRRWMGMSPMQYRQSISTL
ncbi:helix-turn-helix transcriptional regulator [Paenibacillus sp. LHD-117]|uniref:helix-turn-helix transcriptional regulator n=1 Tax=Paenibacillus sp. LHD-117 TaxID=3071412 RepID=UPI0027E08719|nr:helix-turn-helix transcriptional regulator [Paenibacillus sp. LHD-117]MDQ6421853.1 helix-turn-helix transcriptional regulator [Paenibacillus sp. LHD-117]